MIYMYYKRMTKLHTIYIAMFGMAVTANAERLVSLGAPVTETLLALGMAEQLVAVDASSELPENRDRIPQVGYYRMISAEGVLSTRPDRVLGTEDAGPPFAVKKIREAGVEVTLVTSAKTLEGAVERMEAIGVAVQNEEKAGELVGPLKERLENPLPALESSPKVLFLYARGAGAPNVSGTDTGAAEMIRLAGAENAVEGFRGYRTLTPEALVAAKPDVILATTGGLAAMGGKEAVWTLPGMAATPAGRNKRLVAMDDAFLLGFGPRTVEAVDALRGEISE